MKNDFDPIEYKKNTIKIWNEVAPRYHKRWAKNDVGPFGSTTKIIKLAKIRSGNWVIDLACGTGVVTKKISSKVGKHGMVIGIDASLGAIKIARQWIGQKKNVEFVISDAEKIGFAGKFDVVTCQYGLFFFPNTQQVLSNLKHCLKKNGLLAVSVHGKKNTVPFFSSILDAVTKYVPDYIPADAPPLDRFGTKQTLQNEIAKSGFYKIKVKQYVFRYSPGTFHDYWDNYLKYIAKPFKEKLNSLSPIKKRQIKELVRKNTQKYTKPNGKIVFPWKVLILTCVVKP